MIDRVMGVEACLTALYQAFNARDVDAVVAQLAPDVDWPNAWEGGRVHGHDGVRAYWERQWAQLDPVVVPTAFGHRGGDVVEVAVRQTVRTRAGALVGEGIVVHVYTLRGGLVTRMDVEEPHAAI